MQNSDIIDKNISEIKWKIKNAKEQIDALKDELKRETHILQSLESKLKSEENKLLVSNILDHVKFKNPDLSYNDKILIANAIDISSYSQYYKYNYYGDYGESDGETILYPEYPVLYSQIDNIAQNITKTKKYSGKLIGLKFEGIRNGTGVYFNTENEYNFKYEFEYIAEDGTKYVNVCIM